ncbi:bifunctional heptose 7-phosphate kinase/heptose 1-phosphate adenyltransferase, partial [Candidatus Omnitrophota bacterium]
ISDKTITRVAAGVKKILKDVDAVIIEDYGKGVVTSQLLKKIFPMAKAKRKMIAVDPKEEHFDYYKGASLITPNISEASEIVGFAISDDAQLKKAGKKIMSTLNCKMVLMTLGERGMCLFQRGFDPQIIPTMAQEVYDVSGAGDTVIAAFTLSFVSGAGPVMAAKIANCAAGIVVGKFGTAVVTPEEIINRIK